MTKRMNIFWGAMIGVLVSLPLLLISILSAGLGHGTYFLAKIIFPITMLSTLLFDVILVPFIVVAFIQFPCYGMLLGYANSKGQFKKYLSLLFIKHCILAIFAILLMGDNFS